MDWKAAKKSFDLLRSFSVLSLIAIALTSSLSGYVLFRFLGAHLLERDAVVSMEFIQRVTQSDDLEPYFRSGKNAGDRQELEKFFNHIKQMPDVVRANVYAKDQSVIWSSDYSLVGKRFTDNDELQKALTGHLVFKHEHRGEFGKIEHVSLPEHVDSFLESYIPIWNRQKREVIGVVEIYKTPVALFRAFNQGRWLVAIISLLSGLILYAILFWIVRRGSLLIQQQQQALLESEKLAVMGEMASAITHNLRNPLAAIRSSAELTLTDNNGVPQEYAKDIITQVDRLDEWIRNLLIFVRNGNTATQTAIIREIVKASLAYFGEQPEKQAIKVTVNLPAELPPVRVNPDFLQQVLTSLIANALEAMPSGGQLNVQATLNNHKVTISLTDTGVGIPKQQLKEVLEPLVSFKSGGLGVGLPLAKRILQRYDGNLQISSNEGSGTTVLLQLPATS